MPDAVTALAAAFPPPDRAAWLAQVEKTLKGAGADTLVSHTADGVEIQPLYGESDATALPSWRRRHGERAWEVRSEVDLADPALANSFLLADLAGGADSVLVRLTGDEDLARALDGVLLEVAPVALDAGFAGPRAADALHAVAKASPGALPALHMDPLSALAAAGTSPGPVESHIISAATVGARLAEIYPQATLMLASGRVVHEAGGTEAQELAFALAAALSYARALVRAGLSMDRAFGGIVLGLAADDDYFLSIAKLRAARRLWARLAEACGAPTPARIEARSSARMLTRADAWTNMVRLTAAGFAAAVGGADAIVLAPFTEPLGPPTSFARRQARNAQLVLMEEAHLGRVEDPAGGAGYIESVTDALAREAWALFQRVENAGGLARALEGGQVAAVVARAREALVADFREGRRKLLGVTDFRSADDTPPETAAETPRKAGPDVRLPGPDTTCPPLTPWRFEEAL